ncbi:hypothetical protein [Nostoc sp. CCY 9925]|uniref:hypothetical protein n=1 Tax=Nostoc sp. CCY 9925 TaxID=3103865 RepID=UPI0039C6332F
MYIKVSWLGDVIAAVAPSVCQPCYIYPVWVKKYLSSVLNLSLFVEEFGYAKT